MTRTVTEALMDVLYEQIGDGFAVDYPYAIFIFHGVYDIPVKTKDKEWLEGSEEIYDFMICTISPLKLFISGARHKVSSPLPSKLGVWMDF